MMVKNKNSGTVKNQAPDSPRISPQSVQKPALSTKSQDFGSGELGRLFSIIDQLRECGVAEDISLPQLVVVGDQSSGKSSVLEALTNIPFPVASTLCTRFATHINFSRRAEAGVSVAVVREGQEGHHRLHNSVNELDAETFAGLLADASEVMELPRPGDTTTAAESLGKRFSDDVLKIEIYGPDKPHFSVVDVPGLFRAATTMQTTDDIEIVKQLVKRYIVEPRTIILAVASAVNEVANQEVFHLAKEADPTGTRTVGLLTKPDAVQPGDEGRVMDVAENRVTQLTHGWFVVRNRSTEEVQNGVTAEQRIQKEKLFFQKTPWKHLDKNRVGGPALEKFLRRLLFEHIRKEYPKLVKELAALHTDCVESIKGLGPARETADQQRQLLLKLSSDFQNVSRDALLGQYQQAFFDSQDLRLRTSIVHLCEKFAQSIRDHGHLHDLENGDSATINAWILETYKMSRGAELAGLVNPDILKSLFRKQTVAWEPHAHAFIDEIRTQVNEFIRQLLIVQCTDDELRDRVWQLLHKFLVRTDQAAKEELTKILNDERDEILLTYDVQLGTEVESSRKERYTNDIKGNAQAPDDNLELINITESLMALFQRSFRSREEQATAELFDYLKSYYAVARTRFIDCVCLQVVERHFMGSNGIVKAFSPEFVGGLSVETLQAIAGEDFVVVRQRQALRERLGRLEKALKIATSGYGV